MFFYHLSKKRVISYFNSYHVFYATLYAWKASFHKYSDVGSYHCYVPKKKIKQICNYNSKDVNYDEQGSQDELQSSHDQLFYSIMTSSKT